MFMFIFPWDEIVYLREPCDRSDRIRPSIPSFVASRKLTNKKIRLNGNKICATLLSDQQTGQHQSMSRGLAPVSVSTTCLSIWGASRSPWSRGLAPVSVT